MSEGGLGWVAMLLDRLDFMADRGEYLSNGYGPDVRPGDVVQRNFWFCTIDDRSTIDTRHRVGVENMMLEVDYPHGDSTWPDTQRVIEEHWGHIPDDELRLMTHANAAALFRQPAPRGDPALERCGVDRSPPRTYDPQFVSVSDDANLRGNDVGLLDGKVAVITGAGSGMAKASAKLFVAEGARVVAADISGAEKDTAAEIGEGVLPVHCDVGAEDDVAALFEAAVAEFGRVDAVLNVAGIGIGGPIHKTEMSDFDKVMDVDLRGVFLGMKYGIPRLREGAAVRS